MAWSVKFLAVALVPQQVLVWPAVPALGILGLDNP